MAGAARLNGRLAPAGGLDGADAVFVGAAIDDRSAQLLAGLHDRAPGAPLFAMEGLLDDEFAASLPGRFVPV